MQVTGSQFTNTVAALGNDIATFPDSLPEIRAPAGTLPRCQPVTSFISHPMRSSRPATRGRPLAMNPAALKTNLADLKANGILIVKLGRFAEPTFARRK